MGKLIDLVFGRKAADPDPRASDTEIPEKCQDIRKPPSTGGVEILRMRSFPVERIMGLFGLQEDTTPQDKIWRADWTDMPDFLRNATDAIGSVRIHTLLPASQWTVDGLLADAKIKVLLTSVIALEARATEFYKKKLPIILRPEVSLMADVQYQGRPRRLKIRAPYTIWHGDEKNAGISIVIFLTEAGYHAEAQSRCFAYMGAIHRARKAIHQDACINGIATDGKHWTFIRIDNKSKVSFGYSDYLHQVYTNLKTMVRHALHLASQRVAASTTGKLPSSIRFYDPYKEMPPEMNIDTDTEFE